MAETFPEVVIDGTVYIYRQGAAVEHRPVPFLAEEEAYE